MILSHLSNETYMIRYLNKKTSETLEKLINSEYKEELNFFITGRKIFGKAELDNKFTCHMVLRKNKCRKANSFIFE